MSFDPSMFKIYCIQNDIRSLKKLTTYLSICKDWQILMIKKYWKVED